MTIGASKVSVRVTLTAVGMLALAGCAAIPGTGPLRMEIDAQASEAAHASFVLVDIDDFVLSALASRREPTLAQFGDHRPPTRFTIGVGDVVTVTIWEAGSGGLFSAPAIGGVSPGSRTATIPEQQVGQDGAITIPFAGRVMVAGQTTEDVERTVEQRLTGRAIQPQVLVSVSRSVSNSATVLGEVGSGARIPLSPRGDRILDVIAAAGGVSAPIHETFVSITRAGRTVSMPMQALLTTPRENIYVRPGDTLTLVRRPQTFTAFGATGRNAIVPFDAIGITLEEAVAKAGGLLDQRADPRGVFLFRYEDADLVRAIAPPGQVVPGTGRVRVVYRLDMRHANAIFLGRGFAVRDKDALYVANAPLADIQKIFALFNTVAQPAVTGVAISSGL